MLHTAAFSENNTRLKQSDGIRSIRAVFIAVLICSRLYSDIEPLQSKTKTKCFCNTGIDSGVKKCTKYPSSPTCKNKKIFIVCRIRYKLFKQQTHIQRNIYIQYIFMDRLKVTFFQNIWETLKPLSPLGYAPSQYNISVMTH